MHQIVACWLFFLTLACVVGIAGCADEPPKPNLAAEKPSGTVADICKIAADLFRIDRSKVGADTSLADLGADDLDYVELIMELEEEFDVAISDETASDLTAGGDASRALKNVTMTRLASLVDQSRGKPRSRRAPPGQPADKTSAESPAENAAESSQGDQVKVYLNPLILLLAGAEKQKGRPLTREEVLEIRDNGAFVMMSLEQARRFYESLDSKTAIHRINPDRIWEEWQELRTQVE